MPTPDSLPHTRVVLRPLASPLPLGLFALAVGSTVLGVGQLGGYGPSGGEPVVTVLLAAYVAVPQLLASVIAFLTREATVATLLALTGMTWPADAAVTALTSATTVAPRGVLYLGVGVLLVLLGAATVAAKPLIGVLVLATGGRFVLGGGYELTAVAALQTASGVAAVATALLAAYLGLALGLEDTRHRSVLPTGRRGEAAVAFSGDLGEQVRSVAKEAGVRTQL